MVGLGIAARENEQAQRRKTVLGDRGGEAMTTYTTIIRAILKSEGIEADVEQVETKIRERFEHGIGIGRVRIGHFIDLVIHESRKLEKDNK